jgi:hypothetical protein
MRRSAACVRRLKTTGLRLRPVYHWTAPRLASHVKLWVLALRLQRAAASRTGDTWRTLQRSLAEVKAGRDRVQATTLVQSTRLPPHAAAVLKQLQVPPPKRLLAVAREAPWCAPRSTRLTAEVSPGNCAHVSQPHIL